MSQNFSTKPVASTDTIALYVYVIEGAILMVFNFSLALVIYSSKRLREQKEYVIFAANMFFDGIFGITYFLAGLRRLLIFYNAQNKYLIAYSRWDCYTVSHSLFFIYITPGVGIIAFLTCFDRFLSVMMPHIYIRLTSRYAFILTAIGLLLPFPTFILSGITSYATRSVYNQDEMCILQQALVEQMFIALRSIRIISTLLGVLLYIIVAKRIYKILKPSNDNRLFNTGNKKRLFNMTATFILITINQLVLFIAPDIIVLLIPKATTSLAFIFYVMNMNKGVVNILIFLVTQRDLRRALAKKLWMATKSQLQAFTELPSTTKVKSLHRESHRGMTRVY